MIVDFIVLENGDRKRLKYQASAQLQTGCLRRCFLKSPQQFLYCIEIHELKHYEVLKKIAVKKAMSN